MLQTLYKTATPHGDPPLEAEFYTLYIESKVIDGERAYFVHEKHGWWDEGEREPKPKPPVQTFGPEEWFPTFDEALAEYETHLWHRVSNGFVHSFTHDFFSDDPSAFKHEVLTPPK
jgi:hypothetical protein